MNFGQLSALKFVSELDNIALTESDSILKRILTGPGVKQQCRFNHCCSYLAFRLLLDEFCFGLEYTCEMSSI